MIGAPCCQIKHPSTGIADEPAAQTGRRLPAEFGDDSETSDANSIYDCFYADDLTPFDATSDDA